ncbi:hypothetical protein BC828DRAFT_399371 [Blastocladiella britannica]|nr:hypothetical protein BC828DRAFT_399371 [Blastocladiella britannica]
MPPHRRQARTRPVVATIVPASPAHVTSTSAEVADLTVAPVASDVSSAAESDDDHVPQIKTTQGAVDLEFDDDVIPPTPPSDAAAAMAVAPPVQSNEPSQPPPSSPPSGTASVLPPPQSSSPMTPGRELANYYLGQAGRPASMSATVPSTTTTAKISGQQTPQRATTGMHVPALAMADLSDLSMDCSATASATKSSSTVLRTPVATPSRTAPGHRLVLPSPQPQALWGSSTRSITTPRTPAATHPAPAAATPLTAPHSAPASRSRTTPISVIPADIRARLRTVPAVAGDDPFGFAVSNRRIARTRPVLEQIQATMEQEQQQQQAEQDATAPSWASGPVSTYAAAASSPNKDETTNLATEAGLGHQESDGEDSDDLLTYQPKRATHKGNKVRQAATALATLRTASSSSSSSSSVTKKRTAAAGKAKSAAGSSSVANQQEPRRRQPPRRQATEGAPSLSIASATTTNVRETRFLGELIGIPSSSPTSVAAAALSDSILDSPPSPPARTRTRRGRPPDDEIDLSPEPAPEPAPARTRGGAPPVNNADPFAFVDRTAKPGKWATTTQSDTAPETRKRVRTKSAVVVATNEDGDEAQSPEKRRKTATPPQSSSPQLPGPGRRKQPPRTRTTTR